MPTTVKEFKEQMKIDEGFIYVPKNLIEEVNKNPWKLGILIEAQRQLHCENK